MKRLFLITALLLPCLVQGQDQQAYSMFETLYMTPKMGSNEQLKTALANHNKKFHAEEPYQAGIWSVLNGANGGKLVWIMGPTTWTQHDGRPASKAHDEDWAKNVVTLLDDIGQTEYWKMAPELSSFPADFSLSKQQVWVADVKPFEMYRFDELMKKIVKVYTTKNIDTPFAVYKNQLAGNDGRDIAMVWFFDKWAWKDVELEFSKKFEEVHGPQSWRFFLREWEEINEGVTQELRSFEAEMSSRPAAVEVPSQ